jgi:hypothetical protein
MTFESAATPIQGTHAERERESGESANTGISQLCRESVCHTGTKGDNLMNRKIFVAALALLVLTSINARKANAQSCPSSTVETYGAHQSLPVDKSLQSQIEVTYFTSSDSNAFISERGGIRQSATYTSLDTNQFVARLEKLEQDGVASIRKQQSVTSYLGQLAGLNLERNQTTADAHMVKTGASSQGMNSLYNNLYSLDRETTVGVYKSSQGGNGYYNVSLLSSYVDVTAKGGQKVLDYDADILLKPGETAIFKLTSDHELKRSGALRSYMAVTMRAVNNMGPASLSHGTKDRRR